MVRPRARAYAAIPPLDGFTNEAETHQQDATSGKNWNKEDLRRPNGISNCDCHWTSPVDDEERSDNLLSYKHCDDNDRFSMHDVRSQWILRTFVSHVYLELRFGLATQQFNVREKNSLLRIILWCHWKHREIGEILLLFTFSLYHHEPLTAPSL